MSAEPVVALTVGCTFQLEAQQPVTAILQVAPGVQPNVQMQSERWSTDAEHHGYLDHYANRCERFDLNAGASEISYRAQLLLTDPADLILPTLTETPVGLLPDEVLTFVMPSRFCLPDQLGAEAWDRFGSLTPGWGRVQAVVDFVHNHLTFTPGASNPWTTALDAFLAGQGVCRDFAHLAITFCRALNIPARYVFGYIPDDVPTDDPMDFAAWFEVFLDGAWHTFDARNNRPMAGRVVVGRGRDAVDCALLTSFGAHTLTGFSVEAELSEPRVGA